MSGPTSLYSERAMAATWRTPQDIKFRMEQQGLTT